MSTIDNDVSEEVLLTGPEKAEKPAESTIAGVAKDFGVHPLRQLFDILRMRVGAQKLGANEYYDLRVFDPAHDKAAKRAFLGQGGINALNLAINPDSLMETKNAVGNKLNYTHELNEAGIRSTETQAFITGEIQSQESSVLNSVEEISAFFREKAVYPLFCKPLGGSLSVGSVRIDALKDDKLHLSNGGIVSTEEFAAEVLRLYSDGYLLQTTLVPHKEMARISGDAVGSVRVVTTHDGTGAKPLYAVWKIPRPDAISDNTWQDGTMLALLDLADGTVTRCHRGKGLSAEFLQNHPRSNEKVVGFKVPFWEEALRSACAAHELYPDLGICGFDVAVTDDGPLILECNDMPNHMMYQYSAREGARNPRFNQIWKDLIKR